MPPTDDLAPRGVPAFAAEFLGTLLLVLFVGLTVTLNSAAGLGVTDYAVLGLVHLLALAVLVSVLGGASGAHLNPAVTLAFAALRRIAPVDALTYVVLQLAGAVAGALLVKLLLDDEGAAVGYGAPRIAADRYLDGSLLGGLAAELVGALVLTWAYLSADGPRRAWVAGGALALGVMTLAPLTGGALNPARALGPSLVGDGETVGRFVVAYVLGPLTGALLAAALHRLLAAPARPPAAPAATAPGPAPAVHRPVDTLDPEP
jgi:glycerol uptake facilitator-like aquaporin